MIKGITTASKYINVQNGNPTSMYISGNQSAGMMRYNTSSNQIEVYDGSSWLTMASNYATVELTPEAVALLDWAKEERERMLKREALIKNNPALQKAYEAIKKAEANFDILEKFVENDVTEETAK